MKNFTRLSATLLCLFATIPVRAYDGTRVQQLLSTAQSKAAPTGGSTTPSGGAASSALPLSPADRLDKLNDAFAELIQTCEGRVGVLRTKLRMQTSRAEQISVAGGLIGVIGAVATCPHCAAFASGLAGLANPMQQTFKDNHDTPEDTLFELRSISAKIDEDIKAYKTLPVPEIGKPDFEVNLQNRIDALRYADASCRFYTEANPNQQTQPKDTATK